MSLSTCKVVPGNVWPARNRCSREPEVTHSAAMTSPFCRTATPPRYPPGVEKSDTTPKRCCEYPGARYVNDCPCAAWPDAIAPSAAAMPHDSAAAITPRPTLILMVVLSWLSIWAARTRAADRSAQAALLRAHDGVGEHPDELQNGRP